MFSRTFYFIFFVSCLHFAGAAIYFPTSITATSGSHSNQAITVLSVKDQSGTNDDWNKYIEFDASSTIYSGVINFNVPAQTITGATLQANFRGQQYQFQGWKFEAQLSNPTEWVQIGDTNPNSVGWTAWSVLTFTFSSNLYSRLINANQLKIRFSATKAYDASQLDFLQLSVTSGPGTPATQAPTTPAPTTPAPATQAPATPAPSTQAPATPSPTPKATVPPSSTSAPGAKHFNLRILVLAANANAAGLDFVKLSFDSVGMPYDVVTVSSSTSLATTLSTSGVGKYSGIVCITKTLLSSAQQQTVISYQQYFGVRMAVVGSSPAGLPGLTAAATTTTKGTLTVAPEFYSFAHPLKIGASVDSLKSIAWSGLSAASVTPATISDPSIATPAILYNGLRAAAAAITYTDGTRQLHYFMTQSASYIHSRLFSVILLNWLSPGGIFQGYRHITLTVHPDDLFMASYLWNPSTHTNPFSDSLTYRLTANDLQQCANFVNEWNQNLPSGSYVTFEWPYNGAATTWYVNPDPLLAKAVQLQNNFYFVSHTWDHPCDFDTATYTSVFNQLKNNMDWTPSFLTNGLRSSRLSNNSLVNPCITGLFNPNCLRAMVDNGITYAVGDNSVTALQPSNKYYGSHITTTTATHGYAGVFIIPREALNIYYDCSLPAELTDEFNQINSESYTFEQIIQSNVDYAMEQKVAFRHDGFMFHQANLRAFTYNDPVTGTTHSTSLTILWMDRVLKQLTAWYDLPIVSPKFDKLAKMWMDREAMDKCGFNADIEISNGAIVALTGTSTKSCEVALSGVSLSGSNVRVETRSNRVVSFISMTANQPQRLTLSTPLAI